MGRQKHKVAANTTTPLGLGIHPRGIGRGASPRRLAHKTGDDSGRIISCLKFLRHVGIISNQIVISTRPTKKTRNWKGPPHASKCRLHPHRATGGDRDHRNPGSHLAASPCPGTRSGPARKLPEQSQAVWARLQDVRGGKQRGEVPAGRPLRQPRRGSHLRRDIRRLSRVSDGPRSRALSIRLQHGRRRWIRRRPSARRHNRGTRGSGPSPRATRRIRPISWRQPWGVHTGITALR